jgi:hypothetical protein
MNENIIPSQILDYAQYTYLNYTPHKRYSGFNETQDQERGEGDLLDLIGSLLIFDILSRQHKKCSIEFCVGTGDESDLVVKVNNATKLINIKTSSYYPYRDNLNLFIKKEEITKEIDAYIQVFIHLKEPKFNDGFFEPHFHIAGWCARNSKIWNDYCEKIIEIPRTGGHLGISIPVNKLGSINSFIKLLDSKF